MIVAVIQARMGSTRLPGKVLLPLGDTTVLGMVVARVKLATHVGQVVVATSTEPQDDAIVRECERLSVAYTRGSLHDVLDRYYQAAKASGATDIVRITSDCPLVDPALIDHLIATYQAQQCDYASTGRLTTTYPDGMDVEVFSFAALERAWQEATLPSEREHVTPYIWNHPEQFTVIEVQSARDLSGVRVTLDDPADYEVIQTIVKEAPDLSLDGVVAYVAAHPGVVALNASTTRNEGYQRSLAQDEETQH